MANARDSSTASSLDSLVRQIIEHLDFKHAVNTGTLPVWPRPLGLQRHRLQVGQ